MTPEPMTPEPGEPSGAGTAEHVTVAGRPALLRSINEQNVLNAIRSAGSLSRRELTGIARLSKPTIGLVLESLSSAGLVRVGGRCSGARGPSALLYEIDPDIGYVMALDVGFEYLRGAIADIRGTVRARGSCRVHGTSGKGRAADLVALAGNLVEQVGITDKVVTQTVVGYPGVHDPGTGPTGARNPWHRPGGGASAVSTRDIKRYFGNGAITENDINLAALAEHDHGHARNVESFAFVSVGSGIGVGMVLGGKLHKGAHGAAGEIGFMPLRPPCTGGTTQELTSLELAAGAGGLVRQARQAGMSGPLTARHVFEAAAGGDPRAAGVVRCAVNDVAEAIAAMCTVIDPSLVVLGGGIGKASGFAGAVGEALERLLPVPPELRVSAFGDEAVVEGGLVAGLSLAWEKLLGER